MSIVLRFIIFYVFINTKRRERKDQSVMQGQGYTGHITLWDGYNTLDSTYYHNSNDSIRFLELP